MKTQSMTLRAQSIIRNRLAAFLGFSHDGARDLYQVFGYPRTLTTEDLFAMYLRNDIAHRIIKAFPAATWRDPPVVRDEAGDSSDPESESYSPFVAAVEDVFERHRVLHYVERADRLGSIGRFGLLVIGSRDGQLMSQPWDGGRAQLLYLQPYADIRTTVTQWDSDEKSPRFGKPKAYTVQQGALDAGDKASQTKSVNVHWTRVLHIAEQIDQDDVYAVPRLEPVYNRLKDLEKTVGGGAESFWLNARPGLGLFSDPEASLDEASLTDMKKQAEEFEHQLRRVIAMQRVTAQQFQAAIADPGPQVDRLLDLIAGAVGIPKRILVGSERGELSSSQDENNWSDRIAERRTHFATPCILKPLVSRLIEMGELPEPEGQWWVEWPEADALGPEKGAAIGLTRTQALVAYANSPGASLVVPPEEYRTDFLGMEATSDYEIDLDEEPLPEDNPQVMDQFNMRKNAKPRTLYVRRQVLNADEIRAWAKSQGFATTLPEEEMHVTIAYSRSKVDWMKIGESWCYGTADDQKDGILRVKPGGPRVVEAMGPNKDCAALMFNSLDLFWRHKDILDKGASWDWPEYQPHITISYQIDDVDLDAVEPYTGEIVLGPEIFEEIEKDWHDGITENGRSKPVNEGQQRRAGNSKRKSDGGRKPGHKRDSGKVRSHRGAKGNAKGRGSNPRAARKK